MSDDSQVNSKDNLGDLSELNNVKPVSDGFISGLCSATVVAFGFAFVFFGQWSFGDDPWSPGDLLVVSPLAVSVLLLALSCVKIFQLISSDVTIAHFSKVTRMFKWGIVLLLVSFLGALVSTLLPTKEFEGSIEHVRELRVGETEFSKIKDKFGCLSKYSRTTVVKYLSMVLISLRL